MTIKLHAPSGCTATFHDCTVLLREHGWLRFVGLNEFDHPVTVLTSLPAEIYE